MKHLLTLLFSVFVFEAAIQAQAPQLLNYQGVARNGFGNALPNRQMTLRLSIRNGSSSGTVVYSETRTVTTNGGGLYSVQIGSTGTSATTGSLATINWQVGTKFLQVEVDPDAGTNFVDLGTTQLVSVPYAMSAGVATPGGSAGGDLSGTYPNPSVANSAINTIKLADAAVTTLKLADQSVTTSKLADASVTDAKIVSVAGSKVTGNIVGSAANVTGTVAVANGGTGATTAAAARTNLGLGNVDNTSDLNKPISTATQAVLDLKESLTNKSTATTLGTSDNLYPTQNAVKSYVDAQVTSSLTPDATTTIKGKVQLAGDLTGTAALPAVATGAITTTKIADASVTTAKIADANITTSKLADASVTDAKIVSVAGSKVTGNIVGSAANVTGTVAVANGGTGATTAATARTNLGLGNVDNTSDLNKPISTATQAALDAKESLSNKSTATTLGTSDNLYPTQNAVKSYVDAQVTSSLTPDATTTIKGKVQLAGDLTGTAALPAVATGAITTTKLADESVTTAKLADGAVTTAKLADASVTDAKIVGVSGSKVTGTISIANGGTGQTTLSGVKSILGLTGTNVAIASDAGLTSQGNNSIAIGAEAGKNYQAVSAIAIGAGSGRNTQGVAAIGIGYVAGDGSQGDHAIAIGSNAAQSNQSNKAVAIGYAAGQYNQGVNSVAIGSFSGNNAQIANSIAINATGNSLNPTNSGLYVDPIRNATQSNTLFYNATTKEITYGAGDGINTIGSIAVASDSKGATISGTTISLAPADATNGGIVTNGTQTFAGSKTFSSDIVVNGVKIGRGLGNNDQNVAIGADALASGTGTRNTAVGYGSMRSYSGTSFDNNTSLGYFNLPALTSGSGNTSVGAESMLALTTGTQNTSVGNQSLINTTGSNNVGIGKRAGQTISSGSQNTIIGTNADVAVATLSNATAIGYGATVAASNSIQLGNSSIVNVKTSGTITAGAITYPNTDGANGQVLTTNGSGSASWSTTPTSPQYAQVLLDGINAASNLTTPVTLGGISIRVNNAELEISRVSNSDPSTLVIYATVNKGCCAAFNASADNSGGPISPKFGTTITSASVGSWSKLIDNANGFVQTLGGAYFKIEADLSTYNSTKSYKLTALVDGWGKVILRLEYFPS